ncbi:hypothetical protein F4553_007295 [Allocatelliglobosispora scoriae]|uniref:Uncharacterized protein n=1 Tax=Allocatelliglobosispora scoriae TaxID=643052 RepID=A0A841C4W1_9ACTN|nr:hypothetical protein [Allocatelliglobosispora scoriae]MBB5873861.1 hypothetical protein [Allocatelliglobosispora scoriae]
MATTDDQLDPKPDRHDQDEILTEGFREARKPRWERRRAKIREELDRNARGDYKVPTWVMVAILVVIVVAWASLIIWA